MSETLDGGCQCGAVRYRITGERPPVYACHCRECQKHSASAFGLSIPIKRARLSVDGELAIWERTSDSDAQTECYFCGNCGTRLFHSSSRNPESVTVKGGSLDDPSWLKPQAHLWVSRKQSWVIIADDIPVFETQPDNLSEWREGLSGEYQ